MCVAGFFYEPQSCNFGKLDIFLKCSNDISTNFWNSSWGQTCQKCQKPVCPGNPEVHGWSYKLLMAVFKQKGSSNCKNVVCHWQHDIVLLFKINVQSCQEGKFFKFMLWMAVTHMSQITSKNISIVVVSTLIRQGRDKQTLGCYWVRE